MNVMGWTRKNKMQTWGQTVLWSGLALGAGIWLMKEHGIPMPFMNGQQENTKNGCQCH